jgi:hypothetical protein
VEHEKPNTETVDPSKMTDFEMSAWAANVFEKKEDLLYPPLNLPAKLIEEKYQTDGKVFFSPGGCWIFAEKDWGPRNMVADPIMTQRILLELIGMDEVRIDKEFDGRFSIGVDLDADGGCRFTIQHQRWGRAVIEALYVVLQETAK